MLCLDNRYKAKEYAELVYMSKYQKGLFLFQRDLRIEDNVALNLALSECRSVCPIFVFNPAQCVSNRFKSSNSIQFMVECLEDLEGAIELKGGKLTTMFGDPARTIDLLLSKGRYSAVYFNYDITPFAKKRQEDIERVCKRRGADLIMAQDYYLTDPDSIKTTSNGFYTKFTPYYNRCNEMLKSNELVIDRPTTRNGNLGQTVAIGKEIPLKGTKERFGSGASPHRLVHGGRKQAQERLDSLPVSVSDYEATRNDLSDETTQLSAYIKYGCISVREAYYAFQAKLDKKASESLNRQLFWRDFYAQVLFHNPSSLTESMKPAFRSIKWPADTQGLLRAWKKGMTGFPIVDAGMREMAATGYMHNRARLIAASFLPKTLLINWQDGELHFARTLTDYDPASNNGNWQWVAGTGTDSQPYFRVLNPFLQSARYDRDAVYIKKWIPELENVPARDIHKWNIKYADYKTDYPKPIVDYTAQKEKALRLYTS